MFNQSIGPVVTKVKLDQYLLRSVLANWKLRVLTSTTSVHMSWRDLDISLPDGLRSIWPEAIHLGSLQQLAQVAEAPTTKHTLSKVNEQ